MAILTNGLETIELGATTWRVIINNNFTSLDTLMGGYLPLTQLAANPSSPAVDHGNLYVKSDKLVMQYNTGSAVVYWTLDLAVSGSIFQYSVIAP